MEAISRIEALNPETEILADGVGNTLAIIVRSHALPHKTTFITNPDLPMQLGHVVYPAGGEVPRHVHKPVRRQLTATAEVLLIKKGRCVLELYDAERSLVTTRELGQGDVILLLAGGHAFKMLEPTVLLEVKQGPYGGLDEKERF